MPQVNLTFHQIEQAVASLSAKERFILASRLGPEYIAQRLDAVMSKVRKHIAGKKLKDSRISQIIEQAREEFHLARQTHRRY